MSTRKCYYLWSLKRAAPLIRFVLFALIQFIIIISVAVSAVRPASADQSIEQTPNRIAVDEPNAQMPTKPDAEDKTDNKVEEDPKEGKNIRLRFSADLVTANEDFKTVTATGNVIVMSDRFHLTAKSLSYSVNSGEIIAEGDVRITRLGGGEVLTTDRIELSDNLKDGLIRDMKLLLGNGARIAATSGRRIDHKTIMDRAVFSSCDACDGKPPLWQIKADRVISDNEKKRIYYHNARLEFFKIPILYSPWLSQPFPSRKRAGGFLLPEFHHSAQLGTGVLFPYFINLNKSYNLILSPTFFIKRKYPALGIDWKQNIGRGDIEIGGMVSYDVNPASLSDPDRKSLRGTVKYRTEIQHSSRWRSKLEGQLASDNSFLRRYGLSTRHRLLNRYDLEYFSRDLYFAATGIGTQSLRSSEPQNLMPIALPQLQLSWHPQREVLGGKISLDAQALALLRTEGMDTFRSSLRLDWRRRWITKQGFVLDGLASLRGDAYHVTDGDLPDDPLYAAVDGTHARIVPTVAFTASWPLATSISLGAWKGQQLLEPTLMIAAAPRNSYDNFPNEDARAHDLDTQSIFDPLGRHTGRDILDGGLRLSYGLKWSAEGSKFSVLTELAHSYQKSVLDPAEISSLQAGYAYLLNENGGTALDSHFSDIVGRITVRLGRLAQLHGAVRLDYKNLALRRNDLDLRFGTQRTWLSVRYSELNRKVPDASIPDHREVGAEAQVQILRHWSVRASTIIDISQPTAQNENIYPGITFDGFQPIRHSLGLIYEDECFAFTLTFRKNYTSIGTQRIGNFYGVSFKLKRLN